MNDENMEIFACPIEIDKSLIPSHLPNWIIWFSFLIGLTGATALRSILIAKAY